MPSFCSLHRVCRRVHFTIRDWGAMMSMQGLRSIFPEIAP